MKTKVLIIVPDHPLVALLRNDGVTVDELKEQLIDLNEQAQTIQALADAERRALTEDEETNLESVMAQFDTVMADIERRERITAQTNSLATPQGRQSAPEDPNPQASARNPNPQQRRRSAIVVNEDKGKWGFRTFGDYALAVKDSCGGNQMDPRLLANSTPASGASEGRGTDGGFAVPPDFRKDIQVLLDGEDSLLPYTDNMPTGSNTLVLPVDETTSWDDQKGIQAYWEGEAHKFTGTKPHLGNNTIRLNKLTALVGVTEELLEDAPAMDSYLRKKAPEKINFRINDAIVTGNGVGMPMGVLNAPCTISIPKETGQEADTIQAENLINMWARCYAPSRRTSVWLYNQDIEPQILTAAIKIKNMAGTDFVGGYPVYMPPGGLSGAPYGSLFGRPMIPSQACKSLGDQGDIMLVDLKRYLTAVKTRGIRQETSIHLWFDYDLVAFKFVLRVAGQPWLSQPVKPKHGTNTLSPFVVLDERG
ncbi:phage major capsid protein [Desulfobulbus rhabdoformis]|uniref:phage major capsid protein n=1 Tax=Desulfobulbus rhabdoformis TaxID=34032 RepID=UPI00196491A1|nr:phage major capsid protein [Desulfobulbus rhabdoformis]MBM9615315.1 phage major capsid protein [Desulfobulbus rhabdoformis]